MALFKGRLFRTALYAGALFGGQVDIPVEPPAPPVIAQPGGGGTQDWEFLEQERLLQQAMEEDAIVLALLQTMIEEF